MSESVKVGGIRKSPAIDRINSLNSIEVKNIARKKMERLLLTGEYAHSEIYERQIPLDFSKANWKGKAE